MDSSNDAPEMDSRELPSVAACLFHYCCCFCSKHAYAVPMSTRTVCFCRYVCKVMYSVFLAGRITPLILMPIVLNSEMNYCDVQKHDAINKYTNFF